MDSLETLVALQEDGELTDIVIDEWLLFDIFMVTENWTQKGPKASPYRPLGVRNI